MTITAMDTAMPTMAPVERPPLLVATWTWVDKVPVPAAPEDVVDDGPAEEELGLDVAAQLRRPEIRLGTRTLAAWVRGTAAQEGRLVELARKPDVDTPGVVAVLPWQVGVRVRRERRGLEVLLRAAPRAVGARVRRAAAEKLGPVPLADVEGASTGARETVGTEGVGHCRGWDAVGRHRSEEARGSSSAPALRSGVDDAKKGVERVSRGTEVWRRRYDRGRRGRRRRRGLEVSEGDIRSWES